jgi:hypothetical protein
VITRNALKASSGTLVLVLLLAGCVPTASTQTGPEEISPSREASPSATSSPVEDTGPIDEGRCEVLGADAVASLAGAELEPHRTQVGTAPGCMWGDLDATAVQVVRTGAELWADQMPLVFGQLRESGTLPAEQLAILKDAAATVESGGAIGPAQACDLFSVMLESSGQAPGTEFSLSIFPTMEDPQAISGQACVDGVYSSVMLVRPDLSASPDEQAAVRSALQMIVDGS